jgi:amino acid adenylation domain-containing protein/non-ribosomal peptide synthase protein (TIGR01720 family)/FkbM family methyltransferase
VQTLDGFRLSPQQRHLWLLQGEQQPYWAQGAIAITGPLEHTILAAALQQLGEQYEILRTTFHRLPGMLLSVQVIDEQVELTWQSYDLRELSPGEQDARVNALLEEQRAQPLDLARGPLLQLALVALAPDRQLLLVSIPALCADAATIANLAHALSQAYAACATGTALDDEVMQYADVAETLNELIESDDAAVGRSYWRTQDRAALRPLPLPYEQPPAGAGFAPRLLALMLAPARVAQLDALAHQQAIAPELCLFACWQVLLGRLNGQSAAVVGLAYDGRTYDGMADALGLFAKYVPVQVQLPAAQPFRDLLEHVRQVVDETYEFQEFFTWEDLDPAPQPHPGPALFCFDAVEQPAQYTAAGLTFALQRHDAYVDHFTIRLTCVRDGAALRLEFHYDSNIFRAADVARLAEEFVTLLGSAIDHPATAIGALELLGTAERQQLLDTFNQTAAAFPHDACLHELFEAQVARTPGAPAVVFADQRLTYAELNVRANQLAHYLRTLGVGPEMPVGLCVERSLELVIGVLGILKAGGAYVPIDPAYPHERATFMLEDAGATVLVRANGDGGRATIDRGPTTDVRAVVDLVADRSQIAGMSAANPANRTRAENMAYVIYTSGSTGAPKGVVVQHRSVVNLATGLRQAIYAAGPSGPRRVSLNGPLVFDTSVKQLVQLLAGHCLYVLPMEIRFDRAALLAYLRHHAIDVFDCTPSQLKLVIADGQLEQLGAGHTDVLVGGEAIDPALWHILAQAKHSTIYNVYGPTECTVDATIGRLDPADPQPTIGGPIANVQTYVLDSALRPLPIGVAGELFIGGAGVARGYLGRPDQTAERFVPNPFATPDDERRTTNDEAEELPFAPRPSDGDRLYKTGDRARWRADGMLEYLGRNDDQIKIRGFRVELGEIETLLAQHPAVQSAVVAVREDTPGAQRLVAYLVPDQQRAFTVRQLLRLERAGALADQLRYELPNDMIIAHLNKNETAFLYREIFEDHTYLRHGVTLRDGDCVFDVGANIGLFTLFAAHACKNATIYAFEPIPPLFELLKINAGLYDIQTRLFECGLADISKSDVFTYYPHASTMSGRYVDPEEERAVIKSLVLNQQEAEATAPLSEELLDTVIAERLTSEQFTCQLRTISDVMREQSVERIDLLKIDAQKSEMQVLNGIHDDDWPKIRQIVLEVHDIDGRLAQTLALLERHGYTVAVEQETAMRDTPLYDVYAVRPERAALPATNGAAPMPAPQTWRNPNLLVAELRSSLQIQLPDYMLPAAFMLIDALPLTANGKLDRKALPAPEPLRPDREHSFVAPRTPVETVLARIWADVLRLKRVGVNDNFFALGGDSILGIQVVARANQAGLHLVPHQIFSHQTVAELATVAVIAQDAPDRHAQQGLVLGAVPLTPIQHWFFELGLPDPRAWTQPIMLETRETLDPQLFAQVVQQVLLHHDALRLRFVRQDATWQQSIAEPPAAIPFSYLSLAETPAAEREQALRELVATQEAQLDLAEGLLLRVTLIDQGAEQPGILLLVTHSLAVDGFSRRILAEDLQSAYRQLQHGEAVQLPPKTTALKQWAERLLEYAQSEELQREQNAWLDQEWSAVVRLPVDDATGTNSLDAARTVVTTLDAEETRALLQDVPAAYQTQINDVLLTALVQAFAPWLGTDALLIDLRGHGRETIFDDIDLSRTVGWLTTIFPVLLNLNGATQPGEALKLIKEQLRRIPNHGLGYGVLRYLGPDANARAYLQALPQAQVSFNYLGQFDQVLSEESLFAVSQERSDPSSGMWGPRYLLEIQGGIIGEQLSLAWKYSGQIHEHATIERLAQGFLAALRALIAHCRSSEAVSYTPSDFPLANLNQQALDAILSRVRKAQE